MIADRQITPEGVNWLTLATDPFHDVPLAPSGYPDLNVCSSIVQCFTSTANIAAPSITDTAPWEAHVFLAPFTSMFPSPAGVGLVAHNYNYASAVVSATPASLSPPTILPGYNVLTGPLGADWQNITVSSGFVNASGTQLLYPRSAVGGLYRMIGCGVEVVNTTAELYKSGSVTCYRAPSHKTIANPVQGFYLNAHTFDLPPSTQSQAQLYPTSRTWAAAEGYYGIGTMSDAESEFQASIPCMPFGWRPPSVTEISSNATCNIWAPAAAIASQQASPVLARVMPFDTHGCVFSGLNAQSTLQVTVKYFVERIPSVTEPDLLVLTRPPSPYDSTALELYARTIAQLPVGCMVKENPLGEWFDDVLSTVAEFAPAIGTVFGPLGKTLGTGIAGGAKTWMESRKQQPQVMSEKTSKPKTAPKKAAPTPAKKKQRRKRKARGNTA